MESFVCATCRKQFPLLRALKEHATCIRHAWKHRLKCQRCKCWPFLGGITGKSRWVLPRSRDRKAVLEVGMHCSACDNSWLSQHPDALELYRKKKGNYPQPRKKRRAAK